VQAYSTAHQREVVEDLAFSPDGRKLHVAGSFHFWGDRQRNEYYARFSVDDGGVPRAPEPAAAPSLVGTVRARSWVTCDPGRWRNHPDRHAYAWTLDGAPIAGADGRDLPLADAYAGHRVGCRVTARNVAGAATAASDDAVVAVAQPSPGDGGSSTPGGGDTDGGGSPPPADIAADVTLPRLQVARTSARVRRPSAVVVRLTVSEPARLQVVWRACDRCQWRHRGLRLAAGRHHLTLRRVTGRRRLPAGRYRIRFVARDSAGNRSRRVTLTVALARR
jgi:hypothetical protein